MRAASFVASSAIAVFVALRYWQDGSGFSILWLAPILGLIWFHDECSNWVLGWFVAHSSDAESSPSWIAALAGWLALLGLLVAAAL